MDCKRSIKTCLVMFVSFFGYSASASARYPAHTSKIDCVLKGSKFSFSLTNSGASVTHLYEEKVCTLSFYPTSQKQTVFRYALQEGIEVNSTRIHNTTDINPSGCFRLASCNTKESKTCQELSEQQWPPVFTTTEFNVLVVENFHITNFNVSSQFSECELFNNEEGMTSNGNNELHGGLDQAGLSQNALIVVLIIILVVVIIVSLLSCWFCHRRYRHSRSFELGDCNSFRLPTAPVVHQRKDNLNNTNSINNISLPEQPPAGLPNNSRANSFSRKLSSFFVPLKSPSDDVSESGSLTPLNTSKDSLSCNKKSGGNVNGESGTSSIMVPSPFIEMNRKEREMLNEAENGVTEHQPTKRLSIFNSMKRQNKVLPKIAVDVEHVNVNSQQPNRPPIPTRNDSINESSSVTDKSSKVVVPTKVPRKRLPSLQSIIRRLSSSGD